MFKKIIVSLNIFFALFFFNSSNAVNLDPEKILNNIDDLYRSKASHAILTLSVTTINWQRSLTIETFKAS